MLLIIWQGPGIVIFSLFVLEVGNIGYSTITFSYYDDIKMDIFKKSSHLQH
jgi:hypothetical protein